MISPCVSGSSAEYRGYGRDREVAGLSEGEDELPQTSADDRRSGDFRKWQISQSVSLAAGICDVPSGWAPRGICGF